jgi:4-cresol dehydrogenase (hydroxylating)
MQQAMPVFRDACNGVKAALDPNGVIAPGRYGIG